MNIHIWIYPCKNIGLNRYTRVSYPHYSMYTSMCTHVPPNRIGAGSITVPRFGGRRSAAFCWAKDISAGKSATWIPESRGAKDLSGTGRVRDLRKPQEEWVDRLKPTRQKSNSKMRNVKKLQLGTLSNLHFGPENNLWTARARSGGPKDVRGVKEAQGGTNLWMSIHGRNRILGWFGDTCRVGNSSWSTWS